MLPDTLEGSIHDLTQNILADYTAGRPIDRIEPFNQPDRDVIIALIGKLRRIVFPGYFRDPAYHVYSAAHSLSALIEDTAYLLQKQIAIALRCGSSVTQEAAADIDRQAQEMTVRFLEKIPDVRALLATDLQAFYDGDPAATSLDEIIIAYPGLLAITVNRLAHELFLLKVPLIPRIMTEYAHGRTGIDIHPGATIGKYFFIDHGTGIVVHQTLVGLKVESRAVHLRTAGIQCAQHGALARVGCGQCFQRGDRCAQRFPREGQTLDRRQTDAQPGKTAGACVDTVQVNICTGHAAHLQAGVDHGHQGLAVGHACVQIHLVQQAVVLQKSHTGRLARRIHG